jgi:hypothetical protein
MVTPQHLPRYTGITSIQLRRYVNCTTNSVLYYHWYRSTTASSLICSFGPVYQMKGDTLLEVIMHLNITLNLIMWENLNLHRDLTWVSGLKKRTNEPCLTCKENWIMRSFAVRIFNPILFLWVGCLTTLWVSRPHSVDDKIMNMKQSVECELLGETKILGKKTSPDSTSSNMTRPGIETGPPRWEADE